MRWTFQTNSLPLFLVQPPIIEVHCAAAPGEMSTAGAVGRAGLTAVLIISLTEQQWFKLNWLGTGCWGNNFFKGHRSMVKWSEYEHGNHVLGFFSCLQIHLVSHLHQLTSPHLKNGDKPLISHRSKVAKCCLERTLIRFFCLVKWVISLLSPGWFQLCVVLYSHTLPPFKTCKWKSGEKAMEINVFMY